MKKLCTLLVTLFCACNSMSMHDYVIMTNTRRSVVTTACQSLKMVSGDLDAWIIEGCSKKFCCVERHTGGFSNNEWTKCKLCPSQ